MTATAWQFFMHGAGLSGRHETLAGIAKRSVPPQHYERWWDQPLRYRDAADVQFEVRPNIHASIRYDLVDRGDTLPMYAEQRDYIAEIDLLIFVVDSQRERIEAGIEELERIRSALTRLGRDPDLIPVVFQLNKRDLPNAVSEEVLRGHFHAPRCAYVATCAPRGHGIDDVIAAAIRLAHELGGAP